MSGVILGKSGFLPRLSVLIFGTAVALAAILLPHSAVAHGGVSIEDDTCVITIGPYRAHFSGYQPRSRASREFCEDIPVVADAIIVIDYVSSALREMEVDFRIVADVKDIGVNATFDDLGTAADIEAATIAYIEPASYANGNFEVTLTFEAAGSFIGIMTAHDKVGNRSYVSVFPFSVGKVDWWGPLRWAFVVLLFVAAIYKLAPKGGARSEEHE